MACCHPRWSRRARRLPRGPHPPSIAGCCATDISARASAAWASAKFTSVFTLSTSACFGIFTIVATSACAPTRCSIMVVKETRQLGGFFPDPNGQGRGRGL
jgi:hypothetical protein